MSQEWRDQAACRGMDVNLFFPERGDMTYREIRKVCLACPVQADCLEWALKIPEKIGLWGGKSARERREIASQRKVI